MVKKKKKKNFLKLCGLGVSDASSFLCSAADRRGLAVWRLCLQADAFHPEGVGRDHCPQPVCPQHRPVCSLRFKIFKCLAFVYVYTLKDISSLFLLHLYFFS